MEPGTRIVIEPARNASAERRTLDERLTVRFPTAVQGLSALLQRLPPGSRIRRAAIARSIKRAYAAANRRDFELILARNDPERYEYRPSPDLLPPDMETVYRGHEGYRRFWRLWLDAFDDIRWDPVEILDFGDRLLVTTRQSGRGSSSGVAVSEPVFQLFTLRRGLVVSQEDFLDRAKALVAAQS
jgi:ketosteroid isomerase-like protein